MNLMEKRQTGKSWFKEVEGKEGPIIIYTDGYINWLEERPIT